MEPKISVIVPVYKVEKYLDRCIESIVGQTYSKLEIILVDDGSPDHCPEICDTWSSKDPRIKVIHQKNSGVSAARNAGIKVAQGDYLYFVDSDDWIAPDLCEKVMNVFSANDVDIVVFDCERISETGKKLGGTETLSEGVISIEEALKSLMQGHINSYPWNKICKYKVFANICFPERTAFEDMAIAYKLILNANQIYCLDERLYYYYQRTDSATANINAQKLGELFLSRWESYEYIKPIYPNIAEMVFPRVALSALRLYDRSLWENVERSVLEDAQRFLKENRDRILEEIGDCRYQLFYRFPRLYALLRVAKHKIGNLVRCVRKK